MEESTTGDGKKETFYVPITPRASHSRASLVPRLSPARDSGILPSRRLGTSQSQYDNDSDNVLRNKQINFLISKEDGTKFKSFSNGCKKLCIHVVLFRTQKLHGLRASLYMWGQFRGRARKRLFFSRELFARVFEIAS